MVNSKSAEKKIEDMLNQACQEVYISTSIYNNINLPLMNITLMNIIDTEQFSELFFRKNHSIVEKNW